MAPQRRTGNVQDSERKTRDIERESLIGSNYGDLTRDVARPEEERDLPAPLGDIQRYILRQRGYRRAGW